MKRITKEKIKNKQNTFLIAITEYAAKQYQEITGEDFLRPNGRKKVRKKK